MDFLIYPKILIDTHIHYQSDDFEEIIYKMMTFLNEKK